MADKELRNNLRHSYKDWALNAYGKKTSGLTLQEKKNVLDWIFQDYYKLSWHKAEEFKAQFRAIFKNELNELKRAGLL